MENKKANVMGTGMKVVWGIVGFVILLGVLRYGLPEVKWALGNLTAPMAGLPFAGFFSSTGLLILIFIIGVFTAAVYTVIKMTGKQR